MTTPFDAPDWRSMSQQDRDLGLNNGVAVAGSADIVAGWELRSAAMRARYPGYPAVGRLKGIAEIRGVMTAVAALQGLPT